jgi:hypothetical protein
VFAAVVCLSLLITLAAAGPARAADDVPARRVLVLSLPTVTWDDIDLDALPHLAQVLRDGGVADLSVRGVRRHPSLADGYVTIGAGTRAVGQRGSDGTCLDANEPFEGGTAREALARRTGVDLTEIPGSAVVCLGQPAIANRNDGLLFDADVGLLGDTLEDEGVSRAVIANADHVLTLRNTGWTRPAGLALADHNGVVPGGKVSAELLQHDPTAPYGVSANDDEYYETFKRVWRGRSVVLVEASDLVRYDAYRPNVAEDARDELLADLLQKFDTLVGRLLEQVDLARDAVVVVGPTNPRGEAQLTVAGMHAPGGDAGFLRSGWTRRSGIVSIVDIAPTVLDLFGIDQPSSMEGRPFEVGARDGDAAERVDTLRKTNEAAKFRDATIAPVIAAFVVLQVLLTMFAVFAFLKLGKRALVAVELGALALLGFLPATYLAGFLPFYEWPVGFYWAFLVAVSVVVAAVAWTTTSKSNVDALILALSFMLLVLVVDVLTGARLQFNTTLGYSPTIAGRFAGLGNLAYAQLSAGTLLLAGLVAYRVGGRRGAWVAISMLVAAIIIDGSPFWGSDVGGVLSMVPAYAFSASLLLGYRPRRRTIVVGIAAAVAAVAAFGALDMTRPSEQRTHLGRLIERTADGGWDAFATVIARKLDANFDVLFSSVWTVMFPIVLTGLAYLVYRAPGRLAGIEKRIPPFRASLAGLAVLAALGFALNDSGIAVPAVMLGVVTPVMIVITVRGEREEPARAVPRAFARETRPPVTSPEQEPALP